MNERIRELLKQSRRQASEVQTPGSGAYENLVFEKFAELIVGECADYIRSNYDSWDAEPLAFNMEKDFGLHGDYAE